LPSVSNQIYLILTDHNPEEICSLVAKYDADSESDDSLSAGHLSIIREKKLKAKGWHGITILPISVAFQHFPNKATINDDAFEFNLLITLTEDEYNYALKHTPELLIKYFFENNRAISLSHPTKQYNATGKTTNASSSQQTSTPSHDIPQTFSQRTERATTRTSSTAAFNTKESTTASHRTKTKTPHSESDDDQTSESTLIDAKNKIPKWQQLLFMMGVEKDEKTQRVKNPEQLQHIVEIVIGSIFILSGTILGFIFLASHVRGAFLAPILFASIGALTLISAFRSSKKSN